MKCNYDLFHKIVKRNDFVFIFVAVLFYFIALVTPIFGDDATRTAAYAKMSFSEMLDFSWQTSMSISMRIVPNFIVDLLIWIKNGYFIWQILNSLMIYALLRITSYIFIQDKRMNMLLAFLFCLYPYFDMMTAGAVSTSVTYLWILTAGMGVTAFLKKIIISEQISAKDVVFMDLLTFVATSQEQMLVVLLAVFGITILFYIRKDKKKAYVFISALGISILNVKILLFMPANHNRYLSEHHWFPDYEMQSFINKIEMAFTSSLHRILFTNGIFVVLMFVLTFYIYKKCQGNYRWLYISIFGLAISMAAYLPDKGAFERMVHLLTMQQGQYGTIDVTNYVKVSPYAAIVLQLLAASSCIIAIGMLCNNLFEVLLYEGIIIIGLGTRMIMGFSPTIWASSDRTYLFFWFALIVDTVLIADSKRNLIDGICILNKKYEKYRNDIMYFLIVCAAVSNGLDVFYYRGVY